MTTDTDELPRGWVKSNLDGITTAVSTNGKKVKTKDVQSIGEFPVIDQGAAECAGYLDDDTLVIHASLDHPIVLFGDHTRIVKYIQSDFIPGADGTKLLQAKSGIQPKYLHYLINATEVPDRGYGRHFHHLKKIELPVAPAAEQKRIADKLDTVLTRVDAVNTRLARVATILKRFRQTVLTAAASGQLTADWRLLNSKSKPWRKATLGDLIEEMRNGLAAKPDENPEGRKILRISAVRPGFLDKNDHRYLETDESSAKLYELRKGDLLFTRYNGSLEYVGVCAMVSEDLPRYVYPDKLIRVRTKADVALPKFIELVSSAAEARQQIEGYVKSSAGQKGISGGNLKTLRIAVPPVEEQNEIVRQVETLFAFADRLEARLQTAQTATERLTPALLAKAFRGELVPQDPNDEPASELLRRLQQEAPSTSTKRGRKGAV